MPPASTMMIAIAVAKIGRWMKNPTMLKFLPRPPDGVCHSD